MTVPLLLASVLSFGQPSPADYRGARMIAFKSLSEFMLVKEEGTKKTYTATVDPESAWDEMVRSWNVDLPEGSTLTIRAKALTLGDETKPYSLGTWSLAGIRQSEKNQKDEDGDVLTDTLVVKRSGAKVEVQVEIDTPIGGEAK